MEAASAVHISPLDAGRARLDIRRGAATRTLPLGWVRVIIRGKYLLSWLQYVATCINYQTTDRPAWLHARSVLQLGEARGSSNPGPVDRIQRSSLELQHRLADLCPGIDYRPLGRLPGVSASGSRADKDRDRDREAETQPAGGGRWETAGSAASRGRRCEHREGPQHTQGAACEDLSPCMQLDRLALTSVAVGVWLDTVAKGMPVDGPGVSSFGLQRGS